MARVEANREDLMREAVALVRRASFHTSSAGPEIIVGFRQNGWLSIYFGPDPMYQFDEEGRLRRAFVGGLLYRTQGQTLAELRRHRTDRETTLVRRDLDDQSLATFQFETHHRMAQFRDDILERRASEVGRIPSDDATLTADIVARLDSVLRSQDFLAPAIPGRP